MTSGLHNHIMDRTGALRVASERGNPAAGPIRRACWAVERAFGALFFWQSVSRSIERLLSLDDAGLQAMGLERHEIVARVWREAQAERSARRKEHSARVRPG